MSDPMPAIRNILGMRDWQGDGWTPTTPAPDAADVVADRILGTGDAAKRALHPLIAEAYREGEANGYARGVAEGRS